MTRSNHTDAPTVDSDLKRLLEQHLQECTRSDAALLDRVRQRVMNEVRAGAAFIKAGPAADGWEAIAPGIQRKILHADGDVRSYFIRFAAGAAAPGHMHSCAEECLVLEGAIRIGDMLLRTGDYHRAAAATRHGDAMSETGVLMFVRGALEELA